MLTEERYNKILSVLSVNGSASVGELTELTGTSESTIRRDLAALARLKRLKKVHGGAVSIDVGIISREPDVKEKSKLNASSKEKIARHAAQTIARDDFVFIDAGTTTEKMLTHITQKDAVFVTNAFNHAHILARRGFRVYLTGGEVKITTQALVGVSCVQSICQYNFTKCFLGTNGIDAEKGFTTHDIDEASVKSAVARRSYAVYILADHSKFGRSASVTFADIKNNCIITDKLLDDRYRDITTIEEVGQ